MGEVARHQVQRLGDAGGGDELFRRGGDFQFGHLQLQLLAQWQEALRNAVGQQLRRILSADAAQRIGDQVGILAAAGSALAGVMQRATSNPLLVLLTRLHGPGFQPASSVS